MRKHFLGIGNNAYDLATSGLQPLRYAESDVQSLGITLQQSLGFNVQTLVGAQATKGAIEAALTCGKVNAVAVEPEDFFVLMFACHGSVTNFDGNYYLHLFGATLEHAGGSLRASELAMLLHGKAFKAQYVLTIYDACRSLTVQVPHARNAYSSGHECLTRDISIASPNPTRMVAMLYGCAQNEVSFEDPYTLQSGVLSYFLREAALSPEVANAWDWVSRARRLTINWGQNSGNGRSQRPWQAGADDLQTVILRQKPTVTPPEADVVPPKVVLPAPAKAPVAEVYEDSLDPILVRKQIEEVRRRREQEKQEAAEQARQKEFERQDQQFQCLRAKLAGELKAEEWLTSMQTIEKMLRILPKDLQTLDLQQFVRQEIAILPEWTNSLGMKFRRIEQASFMMGSRQNEEDRFDNEWQHQATLSKAYYMGIHHVTRGQFSQCVTETGYKTEAEKEGWAYAFVADKWDKVNGVSWRSPGYDQTDNHPVVVLSWNDSQVFCDWLTRKEGKEYRLSTEAEYEYAARAGTRTAYFWGDDAEGGNGFANCADATFKRHFPKHSWPTFTWSDGYVFTSPVGAFEPNGWGLYDMIGNAWTWCSDVYDTYAKRSSPHPQGPVASSANRRVLRGGSWRDVPRFCRCACRGLYTPGDRNGSIGLRLVLDSL